MIHRYIVLLAAMWAAVLTAPSGHARLSRASTPEELWDESDFIGIIEPIATAPADERFTLKLTDGQLALPGVNTRFRVEMTFRATRATLLHLVFFWRHKPPQEVTVLHFQETDAASQVANGPMLVNFPLPPVRYEKRTLKDQREISNIQMPAATPQYLAFLKRRSDGRYEPTTGQEDAMDSFRELHAAVSAHP